MADEFYKALESEKSIRTGYSNASDIFCPLEDLILGAKTNFTQLEPGRIVKLSLGEFGVSRFFYDCYLFDAQRDSGPFPHQFRVWVVQQNDRLEWILSTSEVQWLLVKKQKAARVLMVVIDSRHSNVDMNDILSDLSPLVKQFPGDTGDGVEILFRVEPDGTKKRQIVYQVTSALTGPIVVDQMTIKNIDPDFPAKDLTYRRLNIQSLLQSEALLWREGSTGISSEVEKIKLQETSRTRKKGKQKKFHSRSSGSHASTGAMKVDHNYLASVHHEAITSGLMLISFHLKGLAKRIVSGLPPFQLKTVVIGLRAGLLPMFMNRCLPLLKIEVVELDPVILDVAKEYFDFREDKRLKVHIADGIKFVKEKLADSDAEGEGEGSSKVDILIVDVDSPNSTPGFTCPPEEFFEESFLLAVKKSLSEDGIFIINFISWSSAVRDTVYSRLKMVFSNLFVLQPEDDILEVIFALKTESSINEDELSEDRNALVKWLELQNEEWSETVMKFSKLIKPLR